MADMDFIYPLFDQCGKWTMDPFWKSIFKGCAVNKFPKGVSYDFENHSVSFIEKTGDEKTVSLSDDDKELYISLLKIFKSMGVYSPLDLRIPCVKRSVDEVDSEEPKTVRYESWKNVKTKVEKDRLLVEYVGRLVDQYNLNPQEKRITFKHLSQFIQFKKIDHTHITIVRDEIVDITCLSFDSETRRFYVNESTVTVSKRSKPKPVKAKKNNNVKKSLDKYFKDLSLSVINI